MKGLRQAFQIVVLCQARVQPLDHVLREGGQRVFDQRRVHIGRLASTRAGKQGNPRGGSGQLGAYAGVPTDANAVDLVDRFGVKETPEVLARLKNERAQAYLQANAFPLMPGVRESIAQLQAAKLRLGVVTGARAYAIDATLRSHELAPVFETVVSADDVVHSKPAPDCYLLALMRMGLSAQDVVAFEDTEHGVAAAIAAGLTCVAIPTEMSACHDFSAATVTLSSMQDAVRFCPAGWNVSTRMPRTWSQK